MVSVIIPTLNEEKRIGEIVRFCKKSDLVHEVIVIDDGSSDKTIDVACLAGAKVYLSSMLGKGISMYDGLWHAQTDIILYLDGDIFGFSEHIIDKMCTPLIENKCEFVKGNFNRKSGRVTALTAKPLLKAFFPDLEVFNQPLGGIIAGKKNLLKSLSFESDYGVDVGLLIDIAQLGVKILEVDIGMLEHDHQELNSLGKMSQEVVRVIIDRASKYQKLDINQLNDSYEGSKYGKLHLETVVSKIDTTKKIALLDMDGTLTDGRFIERLAHYVGRKQEIGSFLNSEGLDEEIKTREVAIQLMNIPKNIFEKIAFTIPLHKGAQEFIVELKKRNFCVGIISDSYSIVTEIIRKRLFADFSISHFLDFKSGVCTGEVSISPIMVHKEGCKIHKYCKKNILNHLKDFNVLDMTKIYFAGDSQNDICLLEALANSVAAFPKSRNVERASSGIVYNLAEILNRWQ